MLIEEALYSLLAADAGVVAIAEDRIVPGFLEQSTQDPAIAFRLLSRDNEELTLDWDERAHDQLSFSRFRFFSVTKGRGQYSTAKRLDDALRLALHGFAGDVTDGSPPETLTIHGIFSENSFDAYDDETETNQVIRDFGVWASEVRPDPLEP